MYAVLSDFRNVAEHQRARITGTNDSGDPEFTYDSLATGIYCRLDNFNLGQIEASDRQTRKVTATVTMRIRETIINGDRLVIDTGDTQTAFIVDEVQPDYTGREFMTCNLSVAAPNEDNVAAVDDFETVTDANDIPVVVNEESI